MVGEEEPVCQLLISLFYLSWHSSAHSTLPGLSVEGLNQNETYPAWSCLKTFLKIVYPHKRWIKPAFPSLVNIMSLSSTLIAFTIGVAWSTVPSPNSSFTKKSCPYAADGETQQLSEEEAQITAWVTSHLYEDLHRKSAQHLSYLSQRSAKHFTTTRCWIYQGRSRMQLRCTAPTRANSLACTGRRRNR